MRRFVLAFLLVVSAVISVDFLLSVYSKYQSPSSDNYALFWDRRGWLFTHLAGGVLTIVLGPFQLLMQRQVVNRLVHRWTGRLYLLGMLVACGGAVGLIATSPAPIEIRLAFAATTLAWLGTAAMALQAIRRKCVPLHRNWMIRNYLVTLAPITFRLLLRLALALGVVPSPGIIAALLWASWAIPLLAYEALIRAPKLGRISSTPQRPIEKGQNAA